MLDIHADGDHNRSVFTVAGGPDELVEALAAGIAVAAARIDLTHHEGSTRGSVRRTWCPS